MSGIRLLPVMMLAAAASSAVEPPADPPGEYDPGLTSFGGFVLPPRGRLSLWDRRIRLHPQAYAGGGYDSNVYAVKQPTADTFLVGGAGLQATLEPFGTETAHVDAVYRAKRYLNETSEGTYGGNVAGDWRHQGQELAYGAHASAGRADDPLLFTGESLVRQDLFASGDIAFSGRRTSASVSGWAAQRDWREASRYFDEHERDGRAVGAEVAIGRELGSGLRCEGRFGSVARRYPADSRFNDSLGFSARAGGRLATGAASALFADAGIEQRRYEDYFAGDPSYDDRTVLVPIGRAGWSWEPEPLSLLSIEVAAQGDDSVFSNYAFERDVALAGQYRLSWWSYAIGRIRASRYEEAGEIGDALRRHDRVQATAVLGTMPGPGLGISLTATCEARQSRLAEDAARFILLTELVLVY